MTIRELTGITGMVAIAITLCAFGHLLYSVAIAVGFLGPPWVRMIRAHDSRRDPRL